MAEKGCRQEYLHRQDLMLLELCNLENNNCRNNWWQVAWLWSVTLILRHQRKDFPTKVQFLQPLSSHAPQPAAFGTKITAGARRSHRPLSFLAEGHIVVETVQRVRSVAAGAGGGAERRDSSRRRLFPPWGSRRGGLGGCLLGRCEGRALLLRVPKGVRPCSEAAGWRAGRAQGGGTLGRGGAAGLRVTPALLGNAARGGTSGQVGTLREKPPCCREGIKNPLKEKLTRGCTKQEGETAFLPVKLNSERREQDCCLPER